MHYEDAGPIAEVSENLEVNTQRPHVGSMAAQESLTFPSRGELESAMFNLAETCGFAAVFKAATMARRSTFSNAAKAKY